MRPVHRDDAELVVARARVVQRIALGVRRRRALRQVARHQLRPHRPSRPAVEEVVVAVVRAFADLDPAVLVHDHVRLPGPPRPAPHARARGVRRRRAEPAALRVVPADHRVHRDRPLAVVVARGVAPERRDPRERRVDRAGRGHAARRGRAGRVRSGPARARRPDDGWHGRVRLVRSVVAVRAPDLPEPSPRRPARASPSSRTGNGTFERAAWRGERPGHAGHPRGGWATEGYAGSAAARYEPSTRSIDVWPAISSSASPSPGSFPATITST